MTKVTIDRELLERELLSVLDFSESNLRRVVDHLIDVGYTRAAPRQPEGEGLEVVAWQDAENPLYTTAERRVLHDWANNGYPIVELCRLSDAQRAIVELRDMLSGEVETNIQLRQQAFDLTEQRDKLAGLLADVKADYTHAIHWEDLHATMKRIDAALDEVSK